jgi:hypothetical protein
MPLLICKRVIYYSQNDELAFFDWLKRIKCIKEIKGIGDELHLHVSGLRISDTALRDLLAIFERYKIDMKQLVQFSSERNRMWFQDDEMKYWHKRIFGK